MAYNSFLGVGRDPRNTQTIKNYQINGVVGATIGTGSVNITDTPATALFLTVSISPDSGSGVYTGVYMEIYINDALVSRLGLPATSGAGTWNINEIIPVSKELWGSGNVLRFSGGNSGGTGTYFINYNLNLYTILT